MNPLRLSHCGIAVIHHRANVPLFADARTDDALTHCEGCGKPLQALLAAGDMQLVVHHHAPAPKPRRAARPRSNARDQAAALVRLAVAEMRERQARAA